MLESSVLHVNNHIFLEEVQHTCLVVSILLGNQTCGTDTLIESEVNSLTHHYDHTAEGNYLASIILSLISQEALFSWCGFPR
jgi:hypothetical protein